MLISHKWLEKYLPELNKYSKEDISEALTLSLAEVEQVIPINQELSNVFVAEVISVEKHNNSDKLKLCQVTTDGENRIQIVCGAENVREKTKVALCLSGGKVYADNKKTVTTINTAEIRGVESHGMLCSARELGLSDDHSGILILEESIQLGEDISEIIKDFVYEIENKSLSHRGDCFSHKGIARELSAILNIELIEEKENLDNFIPATEEKKLSIEVNVPAELCARFSAILIDNIQIKTSPLWLQARLSAIGTRSINNIVDITNYLMFDLGQPLHAYDYDKLEKNILQVRKAKSDEKAVTLDGVVRKMEKEMVVVTDASNIEDIAGIMGGNLSQINSDTKTIILEAANWEMYNIRRTSRQLGLRTEASTRFEKGLDPSMTIPTLKTALTLISDIGNGELASDLFDHYPSPDIAKEISIDFNQVNRSLNLNLSKYEVIEILQRLMVRTSDNEINTGSNPNQESQNTITFSIPTFRKDLNIKEDLTEEVARIYGFQNLATKLPQRDLTPAKSYPTSQLFRIITTTLSSLGLDEIKTYSFIGSDDYKKANLSISDCLEISNPIAPELSYFRNTLLPSLLKVATENRVKFDEFGIFEIGRAVMKDMTSEDLHQQPWTLAALIRYDKKLSGTFFKTKGYLQHLGQKLNMNLQFESGTNKSQKHGNLFHPFQSAVITLDKKNIGTIGVIEPSVAFNYDLPDNIGLLEVKLEGLEEYIGKTRQYSQLGIFPDIKRDLTLWLDKDVTYADAIDLIHGLNIPLLKKLTCIDTYKDTQNDHKTSITLSLVFQSDSKTLTDEEVAKLLSFITNELSSKLKVEFRK